MQVFSLLAVALVISSALPASSRADVMPAPAGAAAARAAQPGCRCPGVRHHRVVRVHRHARHVRRRMFALAPPPVAPVYYNPGLPSPLDPAYDRAMTLHFRSPPVSGLYNPEPGWPPTPPVRGVHPYRFAANGAVWQYDGLTGEYIALAQADPARLSMLPPAPPPPAAPPPR